jgi:cold shock CspA family protein
VFVHRTALEAAGLRDLKEGEQLTFDVDIAAKGPCAVNIQKPDINS